MATEVLVLVVKVDVCDRNHGLFHILLEVEPALLQPLEVLHRSNVEPDQHVEDVALVHVDRDQGLVLGAFHFVQVLGGLANQGVEQVKELVVGLLHDLAVGPRLHQSRLRVTGPNHLNTQDSNLSLE